MSDVRISFFGSQKDVVGGIATFGPAASAWIDGGVSARDHRSPHYHIMHFRTNRGRSDAHDRTKFVLVCVSVW